MKDGEKIWLQRIGWVCGVLLLLSMTPTIERKIKSWSQESELREKRLEEQVEKIRTQLEPPSDKDPRIVTLHEDVWTKFETPPTGPRKSFVFDRVDPNLWIKYRINGDPMTENTIPPRKHPAFIPVFLERDSRGQNVKVNELCVHRHPDNPPNHEVKGYYVE